MDPIQNSGAANGGGSINEKISSNVLDTGLNSTGDIVINDKIRGFLLETTKWAKFLAILGFIMIGLVMLAALAMVGIGGSFGKNAFGAEMGIVVVAYLAIALLYFFPINYLYKAAANLKRGLLSGDEMTLTYGFENLKSHYKFIGIFMIVMLGLYALIFIGGIMAYSFLR